MRLATLCENVIRSALLAYKIHYIQAILKMVDAESNQTKSKEFCRQTTILEKEKTKNEKISTHTRTS